MLIFLRLLPVFAFLFIAVTPARAIPEEGYAVTYLASVVPYLRKVGETFTFPTRDGLDLSAVKFIHPNPKGTIVLLPGRTEPWLKYAKVFYDLYHTGYSIYSYDHRGQGLSPHPVPANPQIGHIDRFANYTRDFEDFVGVVSSGRTGKLFLLAHSMGGDRHYGVGDRSREGEALRPGEG